MTGKDQTAICQFARKKVLSAIARVEASVNRVKPYQTDKQYTPQELEPYDALSDRFVRAVETSIKFFRSYEILMFAETSETLRDQLNRMEKLNLITETSTWMAMRDVRNRIVHDYLPEDVKQIYQEISGKFSDELFFMRTQIGQLPELNNTSPTVSTSH